MAWQSMLKTHLFSRSYFTDQLFPEYEQRTLYSTIVVTLAKLLCLINCHSIIIVIFKLKEKMIFSPLRRSFRAPASSWSQDDNSEARSTILPRFLVRSSALLSDPASHIIAVIEQHRCNFDTIPGWGTNNDGPPFSSPEWSADWL